VHLPKTTSPNPGRAVARTRLFRALDAGRRRPLTWIWGPPGAGKTTLVSTYLTARRIRPIWYQVDEGDADPATLFHYLGARAPRRRQPLPLLAPELRGGLEAFSRRFFREFFARCRPPFVLVLDNFQDAGDVEAFQTAVRIAVEEMPAGGRAIAVSRRAPPHAFARLRASQAVHLVEWDELRLTAREAEAVVRQLRGAALSRAEVQELNAAADGWAAGVVLLCESGARGGAGRGGARRSQVVFDYFAAEVLRQFTPSTEDFLIRTACLPRMTPDMAERLTGVEEAPRILEALHADNFFTYRIDHPARAYQYHPLFREFLLTRGEAVLGAEARRELRRRAATILEEAGQTEDAVGLLRDAGLAEPLAGVVERHAGRLVAQGRHQTLAEWLRAVPPEVAIRRPWLTYWQAVVTLGADPPSCARLAEQAYEAFRAAGDVEGALLSWAAVVEGSGYDIQNLGRLDRWIDEGKALAGAGGFPSPAVEMRVMQALLFAFTVRRLDDPDLPRWVERSEALLHQHGDDPGAIPLGLGLASYHTWHGDLARMAEIVRRLDGLATPATSPVHRVAIKYFLTRARWWVDGDLAASLRTAREGEQIARDAGVRSLLPEIQAEALLMALSAGDLAAAEKILGTFPDVTAEASAHIRCRYHHARGVVALLRRDVMGALRTQDEMLRTALQTGMPLVEAIVRLFCVQALHAAGHDGEACAHLDRAGALAEASDSDLIRWPVLLAEAQLALDSGRRIEGVRALAAAMALGRTRGYLTTFTSIPDVMACLCAEALATGIEPEYVRRVIRTRGLAAPAAAGGLEAWPWPVKVLTLGRFEVLRDDQPLRFPHKAQRRPLELLKALIAYGGERVREARLLETLWPDAEGDAAAQSLAAAVHRLRALLGDERAIRRQGGEIGLDRQLCWVDTWALDRILRGGPMPAHAQDPAALVASAMALHGGPFLDDDPDAPWARPLAGRLRQRLLRWLEETADRLEREERLADAAVCRDHARDVGAGAPAGITMEGATAWSTGRWR
jgi:hypothetical protein